MERSPRPRKTHINLSHSLEQRLNSYVLAASAAGVAMLALTPPAEAKIVYTKAHEVIGLWGLHGYNLDLNHDGITDFALRWSRLTNVLEWLGVSGKGYGNGIIGKGDPSALKAGTRIGPKDKLGGGPTMVSFRGGSYGYSYGSVRSGYWANVTDRYLGLKFLIRENGVTAFHYGWARLSVKAQRSGLVALLTGYAYETVPNKPIIAGRTHEADDAEPTAPASLAIPAEKPATLGWLALGAPAVSTWTRDGSSEAAQRALWPNRKEEL